MALDTVTWSDGRVRLLDQTRLPGEVHYRECATWAEVAEAIRALRVRGAPAIGLAAAFAVALAAHQEDCPTAAGLADRLKPVFAGLAATRPTAVNLRWALGRMRLVLEEAGARGEGGRQAAGLLLAEAERLLREDRAMGEAIARHGVALIPSGAGVLTHCNTGGLATGGVGTALAVVMAAHAAGKAIHVYADETRPLLQGARLTAWELAREGIPVEVVCDSAAGGLMARGLVDVVIVGADRIAGNGDVANKVGTYSLAVLARHHDLPFYVAAPTSTIDLETSKGEDIPIEERDPREVTTGPLGSMVPAGVAALNPAFDVTPGELVTAIITDRGVVRAPYEEGLRRVWAGVPSGSGRGRP